MLLSYILVLLLLKSNYSLAQKPFVIAQMTNTPAAVRWALDSGAAGIEMDLNFDPCGELTEFKRGAGVSCDCSCLCANGMTCSSNHICHQLWAETKKHCRATTEAIEMFEFLATDGIKERLSVLYIDSKLNKIKLIEYYQAGINVVRMINEKLFDKGYAGQVIINGLEFKYIEYLRGAFEEAKSTKYGDKYFYTFDGEGRDYTKAWNGLLQLGTPNIVYSTGTSVCLLNRYDSAIKNSVAKNHYAGIAIWSLDMKLSMQTYLDLGANIIMTNKPAVGLDAINGTNRQALQPGEQALYPKDTVPVPQPDSDFSWDCDCHYHRGKRIGTGGCSILTPPPPGKACKCRYVGTWTCKGENVECSEADSEICLEPDMSKETCEFGGGDCKGYQCQIE